MKGGSEMSFIHLHVYSAFSLLSSTVTVEQLVKEAKAKGFPAIALTDRNNMYGTISFYKECLKHSIKPIIGLTVDVVGLTNDEKAHPLVLLAANQIGFNHLLKISSAVQTRTPEGIPTKWLKHYANGLYALTPGMEGAIEKALLNEERTKALHIAEQCAEMFGRERFFLSLQNQGLPEQSKLLEQMVGLSKEINIPMVAANSVAFLHEEDAFSQECLLAIKHGQKLADDDRVRLGSTQFYLKTAQEMADLFSEYPDALENTWNISESCNVMIDLKTKHLPKYPLPEGETAEQLLQKLCYSGLKVRYGTPTSEHINRLNYELSVIEKMNFSDYFLIVWDFMKFAKDRGILTGPGRGSAAGSIVAYTLYITDVDPIQYGLLFERFLNPERVSMPDIDIDFPDHRRDEVIEYVAGKYGEMHVAQIITFGTLAAKAAVRDVGRVFGLSVKELDQLSRLIPSRLGITLADAYRESEPLRKFVAQSDHNERLFQTALKLEGLPRHTSTHAAGVVISEAPLTDLIPIQSGQGNIYLTQYSMEHLEELGMLKMDFLGLRNLTFIDTMIRSIQRGTGKKINIKHIPLNDQATFELLSKGDTTGVFQLESEGMRKVLVQLQPTQFEDIVAVNALYRPGPMDNIPLFIDRKHGRKPIQFPHPDLQEILESTYGIIVYQEQIIKIASKLAGFSFGEADLLRRAVSKKKREVLDQERTHFVSGALKKGYDEKVANQVYDYIVRFANYGFNRSHAVAYSFIAYQLAYLKAHFPLHFMAAIMTSSVGNETKMNQYLRDLTKRGIKLLPPSINKSGYGFQVEQEAIRYGLAAIKGIGASVLKVIFEARKAKPFEDLFDFCIRIPQKAVNRKTLEALIHSGALDEFGKDRAILLATLDVAFEHAQLVAPAESGQVGLFMDSFLEIKPKYVNVDPIRIKDKLALEKEVLGVFLSTHPVSVVWDELKLAGAKPIVHYQTGDQARIGVYIAEEKTIRTKKGEAMAFYLLSDSSGELEAVAFPATFRKYGRQLKQGEIVLLDGRMDERNGKEQFIIQDALDRNAEKNVFKAKKAMVFLRIEPEFQSAEKLNCLEDILKKYRGNIPVILHYAHLDKTLLLDDEFRINGSESSIEELRDFLGRKNVVMKK